jgi:putative membrane-bound dehydrogenase-like protein
MKVQKEYVESGHGFIPVHSASACFGNDPEFVKLVGGRFKSHGGEVFRAGIVQPDHPAMKGVSTFECWDETYVHSDHNEESRTVLMKREEEPWTWARTQGKGRVFYTASGHDERAWSKPEFQQMLKAGILWAVGDSVSREHARFLSSRVPLRYEKRDNIPNYENRPEPLPYQFPLSPEDSLDYTQVPVEFEISLFASEPDIINPIHMAWDERGRLWVAETVDYPNEIKDGSGRDRIKILEDTDGDGRCDKVKIFAEDFNIPTSFTFSDGGIIVAHAPEFLFLKDTDGDDVADVRKVMFSGWGKGDTHAGPSSLRYGMDNWIYGTVGYSQFNGELGGKEMRFGQGVFRLQPDASDMEFLYQFNNNTWGVGFNNAGDVFGSTANNNPSFFGGIPASIFTESARGMSAKMIADSPKFHPITPNIRQVDAFGAYTAGAGHTFATSDNFPMAYNKIAFVNGPTGNLTGRYRVEREGAGYVAKNAFAFVASADEWFSPVAAEVGPDGALWIADWYNFIIQHNPTPSIQRGGYRATTGRGNAHVNPNRDRQHGRIYRVVWKDASESDLKSLAEADTEALVAALDNGNQFWRLTAQRLLVQNGHTQAVEALRKKVGMENLGSIHALWSLHGLGALDKETHLAALISSNPDLRRNAIRALGNDAQSLEIFFDARAVTDGDLLVRLAAFNQLSRFEKSEALGQAVSALLSDQVNRQDEWLNQSLEIAAKIHGAVTYQTLGENLLANASFEEMDGEFPARWRPRTYSGQAQHGVDEKVFRTGKRSIRISSEDGSDTSMFTNVEVKPGTTYRLAAWIKTEGVRGAMGALLNVHMLSQEQGTTSRVRRDSDWEEVELIFNSGGARQLSINALFGGWGRSRGTAWYDDLSLTEVVYGFPGDEPLKPADAERGRVVFHEHPIASCLRCHKVGTEGGDVGPVLDGIASRKPGDYIRESVMDPNAQMAEGFDQQVSPMPRVGVLLRKQQLEDLIAYLMTLK